jgi:hypothetical protein
VCNSDFSFQHLLDVLWQDSDDSVLTEDGVAMFLSATGTLLANHFLDVHWLQQLAILLIVSISYNEFTLSMQGRSIVVLTSRTSGHTKVKTCFLAPMFVCN